MHNAVVFTCAVAPGLRFIGRNWSCVTDGSCEAPAGFSVIFPGMLAHAISMGLEIPLVRQADVDAVLWLRDSELIRALSMQETMSSFYSLGYCTKKLFISM